MRIVIRSKANAIAMIMVLIVITVLGILAGGFAYSMKVETHLARLASFETDFEWMGRSGVELARMVLGKQFENRTSEPYDSLKQKWAGGPGNTNEAIAAISLDNVPLGPGSFSVRIVDAERKFNINVANPDVLRQAMTLIGVDAGLSPTIADSILDWIDRDNDEHLSGAESDYYMSLDPPYVAKNGWVDDMSELLLLKGIQDNPAILWGGSPDDYLLPAFQARDHYALKSQEQISYPVGLNDLFTPLSNGRININTAPIGTLQLLLDTNIASAVIAHRAGLDGQDGTIDDIPFSNVGELINVGVPSLVAQQMGQFFGVQSSVFEVFVDCNIGGFRREYVAVIYRMNQRDIRVLSMYWRPSSKRDSSENFEANF